MEPIRDQPNEVKEDRESVELVLIDIRVFGDAIECPNRHCSSRVCSMSCFAGHCFDWCVRHNHPSVEATDGRKPVPLQYLTRDAQGEVVSRTKIVRRRVCGRKAAGDSGGDCHIVKCTFTEDDLWEFDLEQQIEHMRALESL
ncbi:hypothetical protein HDV57DRAFT_489513 [Trichoderma longibrachiatum]